MIYDDNINWSGQRRARELKARVKTLKQRRKAGKPIPISKAAQKNIVARYKQFISTGVTRTRSTSVHSEIHPSVK